MMLIPKEITKAIKAIEKTGFNACVAGECVRNSMKDEVPPKWNIVTNADEQTITSLFSGFQEIGGNLFAGSLACAGNMKNQDPVAIEIIGFDGEVEEFLSKMIFSVNAVACNKEKELIDPYNGCRDIEAETIKTIENPDEMFKRAPGLMLKAIRLAAETNYDLHDSTHSAIKKHAGRIKTLDVNQVTGEFERIISGRYPGKGIRLLMSCDVMPILIGEKIFKTMRKNEKKALELTSNNLDRTQINLERRLAVFYMGFLKRRDIAAMNVLNYGDDLKKRILEAHRFLPDLYFMKKKAALKDFLAEHGRKTYDFVDSVAKAQCIVYGMDNRAVLMRYKMLEEIETNREAVYQKDLVIKEEDLLKEGITENTERAKVLIGLLLRIVHRRPRYNTRAILLDQARILQRNKLKEFKAKSPWC